MLSLTAFLTNIQAEIPPITLMVTAVSYVMGVAFGVNSLMRFSKHSKSPEQVPLSQCISPLIVCLCLVWLPTFIGSVALTTYGSTSPVGYTPALTGDAVIAYNGLIALVKLFGIIAVIRGILILKRVGDGKEGNDAISRASWHIFGGVNLYYIEATAFILKKLFTA